MAELENPLPRAPSSAPWTLYIPGPGTELGARGKRGALGMLNERPSTLRGESGRRGREKREARGTEKSGRNPLYQHIRLYKHVLPYEHAILNTTLCFKSI